METAGQNLTNGQKVNLSKEVQNLGDITLGFGWEPKNQSSGEITLHSFAILQDENGKGITFVSPDSLKDTEGSVRHQGNRQTRNTEGDNQTIELNLRTVPKNIHRISFGLNVNESVNQQQQNPIGEAFMRCLDNSTGEEIFRYDLSENASSSNAVIFGTLLRAGNEWEFQTNEEIKSGDLKQIFASMT